MRVVVADDSTLLREGLARLLTDAGMEVVGRCANATDLMLKVDSYEPQVAVVDIRMPPTHTDEGFQAAMEIRERHPGTGVLVLSQHVELGLAMKLLVGVARRARATSSRTAWPTSPSSPSAVRRVGEGGSAIDPTIVSQLLGRVRGDGGLPGADPARARGPHADGRGLLEPRDRRQARDHASAAPRSTSRASSPSSACRPTGAEHRRVLAVLRYLRS